MKVKYPCDKSGKQFTELDSMKKHIQSVQEKVMFPCDKSSNRKSPSEKSC